MVGAGVGTPSPYSPSLHSEITSNSTNITVLNLTFKSHLIFHAIVSLIIPPKPVIVKVSLPTRLRHERVTACPGGFHVFCTPRRDAFLLRLFWLQKQKPALIDTGKVGLAIRTQRNGNRSGNRGTTASTSFAPPCPLCLPRLASCRG